MNASVIFAIAVLTLLASGAMPAGAAEQSQTAATTQEQGPQPGQTGVGKRGTEVAPSTAPGQPKQPATAQTGTGPRGTEVAPSTTPGQQGQPKQ